MPEDLEQTDDLMPNEAGSSTFYQPEPAEEAVKADNTEKAKIQAAGTFIDDVMEWFDAELLWAKSIDNLDPTDELLLSAQILAKQRYASFLTDKRDKLRIKIEKHIKK